MNELDNAAARARLARLRLRDDWRQIVRRAWSVRLMVLAAVLSGAEVFCGVFEHEPPIKPVYFAALSAIVTAAAFVARIVAQRNMGADSE